MQRRGVIDQYPILGRVAQAEVEVEQDRGDKEGEGGSARINN